MSVLVIVESPTKAKTIKKILGSGYDVKASAGHVRDLSPYTLSVDIKNDFKPEYTIIKGKEKVVEELKNAAGKADDIYLATDPDREGEAISWHLANVLNLDIDSTKRVKFNEINKKSVNEGINHPETIDMNLVNAQQARRILDRIVGYRLSPFVSQKTGRKRLSAGRVQSVAVRIIVDRENEINAFVPEEYWTVGVKLSAPPSRAVFQAALVQDENGKVKISNKEEADNYLNRLDGAVYTVESVKKGQRTRSPAPPFTTSTMQQDASHRLGFTSARTMRAAQELFEGVDIKGYGQTGLITYMRTDSTRISDESRAAGNQFIEENYGKEYIPAKQRYFSAKGRIQDGHEAIRPVFPQLTPDQIKSSVTPDQYKLYDLIWKRFIASLMGNSVLSTKKINILSQREEDKQNDKFLRFSLSGYKVKFDGFTKLYGTGDEEEKESELPDISEGQTLKFRDTVSEQHFTQPPARFSEASLIKTLEETGIGRPSTYATIISKITEKYVVRDKKQLKPTELGVAVTDLLKKEFPKIVDTKFTAGMENDLDEVEEGKEDYIKMLHIFYDDFQAGYEKAKNETKGLKIHLEEDKTDEICEVCGRPMVVKYGKYGKFLGCSGYPECTNTRPFIERSGVKCPLCGGDVIKKTTKKGYVFYGCSNYPECKFATWDTPTAETCPKCGKALFKSRGGVLKCLDPECGYASGEEKNTYSGKKTGRKSGKKASSPSPGETAEHKSDESSTA